MTDRPPTPCSKGRADHVTGRHGTPACKGHKKESRDSACCTQPPARGLDVCKFHGGGAPQVRAAGERRVTEAKAARALRRFGEPIDTTPSEALLDAVKWTAGYVAWCRTKVADLDSDAALTQMSAVSGKREASVWVDMLGTWHDRLVRICAEALRAGIEERKVRLAEQQGALVADVIKAILADLALTDDQQAKVATVVPAHLRRLTLVA